MTAKPCLDCGQPTASTRCPEHRGYDRRWRVLSERARKLQPWCSDCGATEDLEADHSPEAWARIAAGKMVRLRDVDVVCGPCNRARGQARPEPKVGQQISTEPANRKTNEKRCRTTAVGGGMSLTSTVPPRPSRGERYTRGGLR